MRTDNPYISPMNKTFCAFFLALLVSATSAFGATLSYEVLSMNQTQYNAALVEGQASWTAYARSGFTSTLHPEMYLTAGSGTTVTANHTWNQPEQFSLTYDIAGNLEFRMGSTVIVVQPTMSFSSLLIQVQDYAFFSPTSLTDWEVNGVEMPDMIVENGDSPDREYSTIRIDGINSQPFTITGSFNKPEFSFDDESTIRIAGIVPEPSSAVLAVSGALLMLRRSRKDRKASN